MNPDFKIRTEEGRQAFREELAFALVKTPRANAQTRPEFKQKAERLAAELFRKGQNTYKLPHIKLKIYWDSIKLDEIGIAISDTFEIHLSEIMFFSYHREYMDEVIPHEVAHLLHAQKWGFGNKFHDPSFWWIVKTIAPKYDADVELDRTPACRLLRRLVASEGYNGPVQVCM